MLDNLFNPVTLLLKSWRALKRIVRKVEADPNAKFYMDEALTPVVDEDAGAARPFRNEFAVFWNEAGRFDGGVFPYQ